MGHILQRLFQQPYLLLVVPPLLWATNAVVGRMYRDDIDPISLAVWRWTLAAGLLLWVARRQIRQDATALWHRWPIVLLCAVTGISAFNTLLYQGLQTTTALNGALVQSAIPVVIVGLAYLALGDRLSRRQAGGLVLSLAGVTTIICRGDLGELLELRLNRGDLWVLLAVVSYAIYSVGLRGRPVVHPLSWLAATFFVGALLLWPLHGWRLAMAITPALGPTDSTLWLVIGYLAVGPSFLAYLCFNRGVELVGPGRAGQFIHLVPVFTSLLAVGWLGETWALFHGVGIACIASGIVLASQR